MKALIFMFKIFKKFPFLMLANIGLIIIVSLLSAGSLLIISPLVDFLIHPDLQGISPLTNKAVDILNFFNLPLTLGSWLVIFIIFIAFNSAFRLTAQYSILRIKFAIMQDTMLETFKDFFNSQWHFFSSSKQGVLLNTFVREINMLGTAFGAMAKFFANMLQTIFYLAVPFYICWQVTTISLGIALLFALPFMLLGKFSYRMGVLNTSTSNRVSSVIHENLSLAKIVLGFNSQRKSIDNLSNAYNAHCRAGIKSQILNVATPILYRPFGIFMVVIALLTARRFEIPLSEIMVLLFALLQVAVSIGNLTMQKNALENFSPSYEQIERLRKRARQLKHKSGGRHFDGFTRELSIKELSFAYPGHEPILVDINMRISKGTMVAFVGESGSGKTTLIDMIMGFHRPMKGRITFDGVPLEDFDTYSYRFKIGYVPQDSVLFNISIRENLLWAYESATDEEIKHACRQVNADEFIRQLPKGYDTVVGDRGVRLSGGQVQRIALARAMLRRPELLILDEATSSLDTRSERLIQQAVENIAKETTIVVIAHRLSTILNADYIYVLKNGRVVEEGAYPELTCMDGHFNRMLKLQLLKLTDSKV